MNLIQLRHLLLVLTAAGVFTACAAPAGNVPAKNANANSNANSNANAAKPVAAAPTAGALLALDKQANEAYIKGDGKFFESVLSDKLVMQNGGSRLSKTDAVKVIGSAVGLASAGAAAVLAFAAALSSFLGSSFLSVAGGALGSTIRFSP